MVHRRNVVTVPVLLSVNLHWILLGQILPGFGTIYRIFGYIVTCSLILVLCFCRGHSSVQASDR